MARKLVMVALLNLAVLALGTIPVISASAPEMTQSIQTQGTQPGRKLLALTDDWFNYYKQKYPNRNLMVCLECTASITQGAVVENSPPDGASSNPLRIWVLDSGVITRTGGDGGYDTWQFYGCLTRSGNQGTVVTFYPFAQCNG